MLLANLGCGTKTSSAQGVVNLDNSILLRLRCSWWLRPFTRLVLNHERLQKLRELPPNIEFHDITRGLPFADQSCDAVYHSHLLEHLDRLVAMRFLAEVRRVLKPGGIHRIVVPDLEKKCRAYLNNLEQSVAHPGISPAHDRFVASLIEQSVRREATGTRRQRPLRRLVENLLLGDARRRGHTHQWMYDRVNLRAKLERTGHRDVRVVDDHTSEIPRWNEMGLDLAPDGSPHKPNSLYIEAKR